MAQMYVILESSVCHHRCLCLLPFGAHVNQFDCSDRQPARMRRGMELPGRLAICREILASGPFSPAHREQIRQENTLTK